MRRSAERSEAKSVDQGGTHKQLVRSGAIEAAVRLYGTDRIVCGTDGTEFGVDWTRKALAESQIGEEAREQILNGNAAAMLARVARSTQRERVLA